MKAKGVNRVIIAVRDLEKAVALYSKLLGAAFHDVTEGAESYGVRTFISWDAGIELCAPLPGRNSYIEQIINKRGEGLVGAVFCVDDVDAVHDKAKEMGIGVVALIEYDQEQIDRHLGGLFRKYKEYMLRSADVNGVGAIVGQIEPK